MRGNRYAEEQILHHCSYEDLDWHSFKKFYEATYQEACEWEERDRIFENLRLGKDGKPNLAAAILRALKAYPNIEFINDTEAEQFAVIIHRPEEKRG